MVRQTIGILGVVLLAAGLAAQDLSVLPEKIDGVAPGDMMSLYLRRLADEAFNARERHHEELKTVEQWNEHQTKMRHVFIESLGGFPDRTPLNAKVVARQTRDRYRIEKVLFESQPRHYVTAVLYLPTSKPPYPAVLVPCGHSSNGKASDLYQLASMFLATQGIAAFCYDPIGQGERYQLLDENGKPRFGSTLEHTMVGVGSILLGTNTARYRIWDGMRSIDYLCSRDDIDAKHIGCTGNSGGGTLTSYLMALDDRILCAAPSCYLTTLKRLLETIGPQDAEQNIFAQIANGMDHADYILMRAPKPTLMCVATRDFFDIDGAWNTFRDAKRVYTRYGFPERVNIVETDATHGFSSELRQGMARWMRRWLLDKTDPVVEPEFEIMTDEEMQCSPKGQVMLMDDARSVFDINKDIEAELKAARRRFWQKTSPEVALAKVREAAGIRRLEDLPEPGVEDVPGSIGSPGFKIDKIILKPEPSILLPGLVYIPDKPNGERYLYVHGEGKHVDAGANGKIEQLARSGNDVLSIDLRGIGEMKNASGSKGWAPYFGTDWKDYFTAYLLGKSYVGMRAEDILTCARFLAGAEKNRVHLIAIGEAGPPAIHAAALEPELFKSVRIERSVVSWSNVVQTPVTRNQLINTVHGALRFYDLPDLLGTLPEGFVEVVDSLDASFVLL